MPVFLARAGAVLALCLAAGCQFKNNPPDTPAAPTGPTLVYEDTAAYVASATDPDGDSVYLGYNIIRAGNPSDYTRWTELIGSGDSVSMRCDFYEGGTYTLRVRAVDEHGYYSDWSQWLTITVEYRTGRMKDEPKQGPDTKKESQ
jgi:hypothetical protein